MSTQPSRRMPHVAPHRFPPRRTAIGWPASQDGDALAPVPALVAKRSLDSQGEVPELRVGTRPQRRPWGPEHASPNRRRRGGRGVQIGRKKSPPGDPGQAITSSNQKIVRNSGPCCQVTITFSKTPVRSCDHIVCSRDVSARGFFRPRAGYSRRPAAIRPRTAQTGRRPGFQDGSLPRSAVGPAGKLSMR